MAYNKTNWQNGITPINETNLNKIEDGIYDANTTINVSTPGTDLNNYLDDNRYWFTIANTPNNKPSSVENNAGWLEVLTSGTNNNYKIQRWTVYQDNTVYQRQRYGSGSWSDWDIISVPNIIETGSNSSANYIKYADGTLIQYGVATMTATTSRSAGGLTYYSDRADITLPYNFKDTSFTCLSNVGLANMNLFCNSYVAVNSSSEIAVSFVCTIQNDERRVSFACIGKWK